RNKSERVKSGYKAPLGQWSENRLRPATLSAETPQVKTKMDRGQMCLYSGQRFELHKLQALALRLSYGGDEIYIYSLVYEQLIIYITKRGVRLERIANCIAMLN
ncbi:hypothetical protein AOLI_G00136570, partial [Acnodon oligacanthus]